MPWLLPLWETDVDVEKFDPAKTYDKSCCMVMIDNRIDTQLYLELKQQGYKIIKDNVWDTGPEYTYLIENNELNLRATEWIWMHESMLWRYKNYHLRRELKDPSKFFLLLMNQARGSRDMLYHAVARYLNDSWYSYVEKGIMLPGDVFVPHPNHNSNANDRFYVPEWYANTGFSLVSEAYITADLFVSEKIFKPLAYWHPLVVFGTPNTLKYIQSLGFETFHHVIDESYDKEINFEKRLQKIVAVLEQLYIEYKLNNSVFQDAHTKQILEHNHTLFFDQVKVNNMFTTQVLNPVLEFAHSS